MRLTTEFPDLAEPVGTSLGALTRRYDVADVDELTLQLKVTGGFALTAFEVRGRAIKDARLANVPLKSSSFLTPDAVVIYASAEPGSLGVGASCIVRLNVAGLAVVELAATAGTASAVNVAAGGYA